MTSTLVARAGTQLPPENEHRADVQSPGSLSSGRKRKASDSPANKGHPPRQKITRACDNCKEKKTRCTGTLPCVRCARLSLSCEYNAAYSRGLPPDPLPAHPSVAAKYSKRRALSLTASGKSPISQRSQPVKNSSRTTTSSNSQPSQSPVDDSQRNSPDPVATDFEGNYLGPASGVSFLNRVWRRLHQDETSAVPEELQNELCPKNTSVFMFGDKPYSNYHDTGFVLPPIERAQELVSIYFDYAIVTYRFLHRGSVEEWLQQVYDCNVSSSNLPAGHLVARTAIILMIFAVSTLHEEQKPGNQADSWSGSEKWYSASKYISSMESGPPRLETVQARLGQCLYLLSSSRANECWYVFGTALQLVTAVGLHRKCSAKLSKSGTTYLERELRKRILWSAYTLDKYLNVIFGRPRLLHDEDIDQLLPDEVNDEDMLQEDPKKRTGTADCMMIASVLHFRLGRILGEISRQFYTVNPISRESPLEAAMRLTSELKKWKETTPPLFNSVRPTSLIPPLCRQSQVLQLAYWHAMIHATRSFLLNDFTDVGRRPIAPHPMVITQVKKCIEAAEGVMKLVDSLAKQGVLIQSFWFTHHVCFWAIIVVYIHTIQQYRLASALQSSDPDSNKNLGSLFHLAEDCQQHLAEATRKNCPSRRYSIILEETRLEVHKQIGSDLDTCSLGFTAEPSTNMSSRNQESVLEQRLMNLAPPDNRISLDSTCMAYPGTSQPPGFADDPFDPSEDIGLLENFEGSIWWAQLDSWIFKGTKFRKIYPYLDLTVIEDFVSTSPNMISILPPTDVVQTVPRCKDTQLEGARVEPLTVDELVRHRASLGKAQPVISYPRTGFEYVDYPLRHLDVFAFRVARILAKQIPPRTSSSETPIVVAMLGSSNLSYLVTLLALSKLAHTGLLLSTRISVEAYVSLLEKTKAQHIIVHNSLRDVADRLKERIPYIQVHEILGQENYDSQVPDNIDTSLTPHLEPMVESTKIAWIIHSSGSTGLPKPIFQTQKAAIKNYAGNMNMCGFITLPLYHNHGICCLFRTIYSCKTLHLYNAELPLTSQHLLSVMQSHIFEIFYGVPYALKLLAETQEGLSALARLKVVMFGGSPCPDSLGDLLVQNGVQLIGHYGSTETGQLMTSMRPQEDKAWDYLRPSGTVKNFLRFEERYPGIFELVCLDGWPSKVMSNRPDGAYATKDLFSKHPTMEAYKYYARLDDTIILVNGEKVIPLELEGRVRQLRAISEAIAFGSGKSRIGLAIVRAPEVASMSDGEIIDVIWPAVEQAHETMPAYGQLSKDMVRVLPADDPYPRTDKGTIIRQRFYKEYSNLIEAAYDDEDNVRGSLVLAEADLKAFLKEQLRHILNFKDSNTLTDDADFFGLGMDSLQATQLRSTVMKTLDTNGHKLGLNVAFEHPTINLLAGYLDSLNSGQTGNIVAIDDQMKALISQYGHFEPHTPCSNAPPGKYIVVTGATGSIGCHVVARLSTLSNVQKVYCLIRADSPIEAYSRLLKSMNTKNAYNGLPIAAKKKLIALPSELSGDTLGLDTSAYEILLSEVTDVIHCAWSVNFNLQLSSFEKDNITGIKNLINLCLRARRPVPASFNFCSSISAAVNTEGLEVPEALPEKFRYAQNMGYAQSKLVGEHLCIKAAEQTQIRASVLRIGQVIGDTEFGIWNSTEAIPLMLQSAKTIGALPKLDEYHLWLPVDSVANIVVEISLSVNTKFDTEPVYNIVSPHPFHWTKDLLPYLRRSGLEFEELEQREWLRRLRESNPDPSTNPPIKLVDFFASKYDTDAQRRTREWRTEKTSQVSSTFAGVQPLDQKLVDRMVGYFCRECWGK